jgi:hypothetical protein
MSILRFIWANRIFEKLLLYKEDKIQPEIEKVIFFTAGKRHYGRISGQVRERWISAATLRPELLFR